MSPHHFLILPVLIPLFTVAICLVFNRFPRFQQAASLTGSVALLISTLLLLNEVYDGTILATQFGSWQAPFGIVFVADLLTAAMGVVTGVMAVVVSIYSLGDGESKVRSRLYFHPLYHGLLLGVMGAFLTGDIFNLYVWFEVMLISSFGLLIIGGSPKQLDAGVKYVVLNLFGATLFLMSVGFLYGVTGTLNFADLALTIPHIENRGLVTTIAVLLLLAFGAKAAVFPLFSWLPASYHAASAPVAAIFAALLTKVGVYVIIRVFTLIFPAELSSIGLLIGVISALTMTIGVLGAAAHNDIRRILSFHIISQIGYMLVGLAVATPMAIAGAIFYIIHHIIVKANLFLIAGIIRLAGGSFHLKQIGGLHRSATLLTLLFIVPAVSLAGLPPLSGFWAKFLVIQACLENGHYLLAAIALMVGILTLYSMLKIWNEAFWKQAPDLSESTAAQWKSHSLMQKWALFVPVIALAAITLTIGFGTEIFADYSIRAALQLSEPSAYINAAMTKPPHPAEIQLTGVVP